MVTNAASRERLLGRQRERDVLDCVADIGRRRSEPPTFTDLDHAIDTFEPLIGAYGDLIRGAGLGRLKPTPHYDWLAPFRVPWIRDS
jgi:hypothetical protein